MSIQVWNLEMRCSSSAALQIQWWVTVGSNCAVLLLRFLLKIRFIRILDTIVCSETLLWLFSRVWDAIKITFQVGFMCPFVVIDPTDFGQSWLPRPYA